MKTLIVDDSATIRMMLKGLLVRLGLTHVTEAANGLQALHVLEHDEIDLLLLDIHMPEKDGLSVLRELRGHPRLANLPVIVISSDTLPEQLKAATELGARGYINKPFRTEGLREALAYAVPAWQTEGVKA